MQSNDPSTLTNVLRNRCPPNPTSGFHVTPTRLLVVLLTILVSGIAVPLPAASASTKITTADPPGAEPSLATDHETAQDALTDAREAFNVAVAQRMAAQSKLEDAEAAVRTARDAVNDAARSLEDVSRQLLDLRRQRDREVEQLKLEARKSYKDGNGGVIGTSTLDLLVLEDEAADAIHRGGALRQVASKRADKVVALQSLSDQIAETRAQQAQLLRARRDSLEAAKQAAADREAAIAVLAEIEARKAAAERAAEDVLAAFSRSGGDEALSQQHLQGISDLTSSVASLRAFSAPTGVPGDLERYGNGRIPADVLVPIGVGDHRLWAPAAEAFKSLQAAAAQEDVRIGVTDSYRSYAAQVKVAEEKGLYAQGGLAARPGTSDHGWGMALDLDLDARALTWMRANAPRYGFVEDTPREPWHWAFQSRA